MPFGVEIHTTNGIVNALDIRSAQLVHESSHTAQSGSTAVPSGITSANSMGYCIPNDDKMPLQDISISAGRVYWEKGGDYPASSEYTSNFSIVVYRMY